MIDEKETLEKLSEKMLEMEKNGLQDTPEYSIIVDEWQDLAMNWVIGDILGDDAS
jgi:hypothetical protein